MKRLVYGDYNIDVHGVALTEREAVASVVALDANQSLVSAPPSASLTPPSSPTRVHSKRDVGYTSQRLELGEELATVPLLAPELLLRFYKILQKNRQPSDVNFTHARNFPIIFNVQTSRMR